MRYCIIGHPRCGTAFMSELFNHNGLKIGHEVDGPNGTSNWVYAIKDDKCFPWVKKTRNEQKWDMIIHNIRDPFTAIPSITFTETPQPNEQSWRIVSDQFRRKYVQFPDTNILDNAVCSFLGWNQIIENQNPDKVVRIEHAVDDLKLPEIKKDLENKKVNSRNHRTLTKKEWNSINPKLLDKLDLFCDKYGYPKLTDRIEEL